MDSTTIPFTIQLPENLPFVFSLQPLVERLQTLTDKRKARGIRYPLDVLLLTVLAVDGKTLRGTIPAGQSRGVHLVAAYLPDQGVVLAQLAVDTKENEIVAVPKLLQQLDVSGVVVVGDAMQAQRELSIQVVGAKGDYLWFLKENQKTLLADVELLFAPPQFATGWSDPGTDFTTATTVEKGHGRIEERIMTVSRMLHDYANWPYLDQVFRLERRVTERGKTTVEVRYGITSMPPAVADAKRLLTVARTEWGAELAAAGSDVRPLTLDVVNPASITAAVAWLEVAFGRLGVLVNNAAIHYDTWQRASDPDFAISARCSRSPRCA